MAEGLLLDAALLCVVLAVDVGGEAVERVSEFTFRHAHVVCHCLRAESASTGKHRSHAGHDCFGELPPDIAGGVVEHLVHERVGVQHRTGCDVGKRVLAGDVDALALLLEASLSEQGGALGSLLQASHV